MIFSTPLAFAFAAPVGQLEASIRARGGMNPILVMLGFLAAMALVEWLFHDATSQAVSMGVLIALALYYLVTSQ